MHIINIYKNINEEGKYFYLFFEDAVRENHNLMTHFHGLNTNDFFIVEYDVPGELMLKNIVLVITMKELCHGIL